MGETRLVCNVSGGGRTVLNFLDRIVAGELDASMAFIYNPERDSWLEHSEKFFPIDFSAFARKEDTGISDFASLQGKTIASSEGYALNPLFKDYLPDNPVVMYDGPTRVPGSGKKHWQYWSNKGIFNESGELVDERTSRALQNVTSALVETTRRIAD